jgi:hypothetical protein
MDHSLSDERVAQGQGGQGGSSFFFFFLSLSTHCQVLNVPIQLEPIMTNSTALFRYITEQPIQNTESLPVSLFTHTLPLSTYKSILFKERPLKVPTNDESLRGGVMP